MQDNQDIKSNTENFNIAIKSSDLVLEHLKSNHLYHDSLSIHFAKTIGRDPFIPQDGAYQTLKSKGLDLISNDSLRAQIIHVHDFLYEFLIENHQGAYIKPENIIQSYSKRFKQAIPITDQNSYFNINRFIPYDYSSLRQDHEFLSILRSNRNQKFESIKITEDVALPMLNDLIEQINSELKRRRYE